MIVSIEGINYDKNLHMYILDKDYYTTRTSTTLEEVLRCDNASNINAVVNSYLTRASVVLYSYIYKSNFRNKNIRLY